jgi:hypothetical protein
MGRLVRHSKGMWDDGGSLLCVRFFCPFRGRTAGNLVERPRKRDRFCPVVPEGLVNVARQFTAWDA